MYSTVARPLLSKLWLSPTMEPLSYRPINTGTQTNNHLKTKLDMATLTDDSIDSDLKDGVYQKDSDAVDADAIGLVEHNLLEVEEFSVILENSVDAADVDACEDNIESDVSLEDGKNVPGDTVIECRHSDSTNDASILDELADGND
jgi:hypothetical protein